MSLFGDVGKISENIKIAMPRRGQRGKVKLKNKNPANNGGTAPAEVSGGSEAPKSYREKAKAKMAAANQMFQSIRKPKGWDKAKSDFSEGIRKSATETTLSRKTSEDSSGTADTESLSRSSSMASVEGSTKRRTFQRSETLLDTKAIAEESVMEEFKAARLNAGAMQAGKVAGTNTIKESKDADKALKKAANEALPTILNAVNPDLANAFEALKSGRSSRNPVTRKKATQKKHKILKAALDAQTSKLEDASKEDKPHKNKLLSQLAELVGAATSNRELKQRAQEATILTAPPPLPPRPQGVDKNEQKRAQREGEIESGGIRGAEGKKFLLERGEEAKTPETLEGAGLRSPEETFQPQEVPSADVKSGEESTSLVSDPPIKRKGGLKKTRVRGKEKEKEKEKRTVSFADDVVGGEGSDNEEDTTSS